MVDNLTETHIITGYDICYSTLNTETSTYDTVEAATVTDSVAVIGGLRPFKNYTFTVKIKTVYGDTQKSEPWWIVTRSTDGKFKIVLFVFVLTGLATSTTFHKLFLGLLC